MTGNPPASGLEFRQKLRARFSEFMGREERRFPAEEVLKVDLHCHDGNSDVPDELLGRILRVPETWLTTDEVVAALRRSGTDAITITNHNNARSCWQLLDRGIEVLVGAEFTCAVPEYDVRLHVLTYGFSPEQEPRLAKLRRNLFRFLDYTREHDLPTVLAHPLFFYSPRGVPPFELMEKLTLSFDLFEAMNGQRDAWQNLLFAAWLADLDEERAFEMGKRVGIAPDRYARRPACKSMTGGSDCHMGLFVGATGTRLHVPGLQARRGAKSDADLLLEALRHGRTAPYGAYTGPERMTASFIDYFCQCALEMKDPGLVRLLLHKGTPQDKLLAFLIANGIAELRRHRYTTRFLRTAHEAFHGTRPGFMLRRMTPREYQPFVNELDAVARAQQEGVSAFEERLHRSVPRLFGAIEHVIASRIERKVKALDRDEGASVEASLDFIRRLEVPVALRDLLGNGNGGLDDDQLTEVDVGALTDGLPFPALAALVLGGASFAASRVTFSSRALLDEFAERTGRLRHPRRVLWITDTLFDRNGVATVLRLLYDEACRRDLPIDFAVASRDAAEADHLVPLRPVAEFETPLYEGQDLRVFDMVDLQQRFHEGGYDRVVCSTEALAGVAGLYLKQAFSVPAYFYLHTDWIDFARRRLHFDRQNLDRLRRVLRAFYGQFDGLFVLNTDQREWLAGDEMGIPRERLHMTAHWVDEVYRPQPVSREEVFPGVAADEPVLLFAGRVSEEKGVLELPGLLERVRRAVPRARLAVAGTGPALARLQEEIPDGAFLGWVEPATLARAYAAADAMLLPSRFDTFGCVVLEAMSCGLPVVAYRTKGPKDIIEHGISGYLARTRTELAEGAADLLRDDAARGVMRLEARRRSRSYAVDSILYDLLRDLGLVQPELNPASVLENQDS